MLRHTLLVLLHSKRAFQHGQHPTERSPAVAASFRSADFAKPVSEAGLSLEDISLAPTDLELWIDLGPYVTPASHIVPEDASLAKVLETPQSSETLQSLELHTLKLVFRYIVPRRCVAG